MFVLNDNLQVSISHFFICFHDYCNHKVQKNDVKEKGLHKKYEPNENNVEVKEKTWISRITKRLLFKNLFIFWEGQFSNGIAESFDQKLFEVSYFQGSFRNLRINLHLKQMITYTEHYQKHYVRDEGRYQILNTVNSHLDKESIVFEYSYKTEQFEKCECDIYQSKYCILINFVIKLA